VSLGPTCNGCVYFLSGHEGGGKCNHPACWCSSLSADTPACPHFESEALSRALQTPKEGEQ
jgi:hypothetical protein